MNTKDSIIYLDNNASTQCAPEVIEAMLPFFREDYGNASSPHFFGRKAARAVALSRELIAESINCDSTEIFFTSSATESNNLAIFGFANASSKRRKIVTSEIEHKSVLGPCNSLKDKGFKVSLIPVNRDGIINLDAAREIIDDETLLVSIQGANNEIGTIQPIRVIADIAHEKGAAVHCDAAQLLGKIPVSCDNLGADFISFSSHKAYGPKGVGFLVIRKGQRNQSIMPILEGGGQENGIRPGTLNVPGIVGTGEACRLCHKLINNEMKYIKKLRHELEKSLLATMSKSWVIGYNSNRLPGTVSIFFPNITAELLIARTPTICMSFGSACTSGTFSPSHVLLAVGLSLDEARCVIRLSIGRNNKSEDIEAAITAISKTLKETVI